MKFDELGINGSLLEGLGYMGFENATPIQVEAIPKILDGKDVLASAQTGTGKTAAFILPVLQKLQAVEGDHIKVLVIAPTRELAIQIDNQIQAFSYFTSVSSKAVYGGGDGDDWESQKKALKRGTEIIVATPGKLMSHLQQGYVKFDKLEYLILDEADRMLDIGFYDDIKSIVKKLPVKRQTLLFSATIPDKIKKLSKELLVDPFQIKLAMSKPAEGVLQAAYLTYELQKTPLVKQLIADKPSYKSIIVFCATKKKVSQIQAALRRESYKVEAISSDLKQSDREQVINNFRSRATRVIIATDVISRGIDIKDINLVINYDVPNAAEDYVHRVGRTARADTTGVAITLISEYDMYSFGQIEELIERVIPKIPLPKELGEGPKYNPKLSIKPKGRGGSGNHRSGNNRSGSRKFGKPNSRNKNFKKKEN